MTDCPEPGELVENEIDRVLTQYRESPNLLHVIRTMLRQVETAYFSVCDLPSFFEIDTAVQDQLTLIGKRLGWPRCHCVCTVQPVFGFACEGVPSEYPLAGFCEDGTWLNCADVFGTGTVCINDDEVYRGFLRARRYQILSFYDIQSLTEAIQTLWGATATVLDAGNGRVVIAPGRNLTTAEQALLQLYPRVLPIAPGIRTRFHFGPETKVFGFGAGWGGFCEPLVPEGWLMSPDPDNEIVMHSGNESTGDDTELMWSGPITTDAPWMCEIDVKPYECA